MYDDVPPLHGGAQQLAARLRLHYLTRTHPPFSIQPLALPQAFVEAGLVDVTMHEVGHTLGLRHNFRASAAYSYSQLSDPAFTATHGIV